MLPLERAKMLRRIAEVLRAHAQELAMIDAADGGNPVSEMVSDAMVAAAQIEFFAGLVTEMKGASMPMGPDVVNFSVREPRGVVARIIPFNHPFMFCGGKSAAPLAAGNTVIVKPPEQAPLSSLRLAELIDGILPPGVFNVCPAAARSAPRWPAHKDVAMVALIGSVPTGRAVMKAAADTVKPVMLELGGKNALIAYPDADPDEVAGAVIAGMNFTWCGQSCGSTSRAFIHATIYDAVLARVKERIARISSPASRPTRRPRWARSCRGGSSSACSSYIDSAKQEGARLLCGGARPSDPALAKGFFVEPTVFADVTMAMRIAREEIFGPVLGVLKWSDEAAMLAEVNAVEYGLTCSIWTNDISTAHRTAVARRSRLHLDQRDRQALPRRAVRRREAVRHRPRGMLRGDAGLHAGKEHPRAAAGRRSNAVLIPKSAPALAAATISVFQPLIVLQRRGMRHARCASRRSEETAHENIDRLQQQVKAAWDKLPLDVRAKLGLKITAANAHAVAAQRQDDRRCLPHPPHRELLMLYSLLNHPNAPDAQGRHRCCAGACLPMSARTDRSISAASTTTPTDAGWAYCFPAMVLTDGDTPPFVVSANRPDPRQHHDRAARRLGRLEWTGAERGGRRQGKQLSDPSRRRLLRRHQWRPPARP